MVALRADLTRAQWEYEEENRARLRKLAHKRAQVALRRLDAIRCQDCRHDQVWDTDTDEWWDLDHTDYGTEGSTA
jgi:hypothetical protein